MGANADANATQMPSRSASCQPGFSAICHAVLAMIGRMTSAMTVPSRPWLTAPVATTHNAYETAQTMRGMRCGLICRPKRCAVRAASGTENTMTIVITRPGWNHAGVERTASGKREDRRERVAGEPDVVAGAEQQLPPARGRSRCGQQRATVQAAAEQASTGDHGEHDEHQHGRQPRAALQQRRAVVEVLRLVGRLVERRRPAADRLDRLGLDQRGRGVAHDVEPVLVGQPERRQQVPDRAVRSAWRSPVAAAWP